jgi:hypothetical protein
MCGSDNNMVNILMAAKRTPKCIDITVEFVESRKRKHKRQQNCQSENDSCKLSAKQP